MSESGEEQRFLLRDTAALRHCERCLRFSAATELENIAAPSESPLARPAGIVEHHREGEPQLFSEPGLRCCTSRPFLDGKMTERNSILRALPESNWVFGGPHGAASRLGLK